MIAASFIAFAHFLAFFALAAALVVELVLISSNLSIDIAKRIQRADRAAGMAALALLLFGFLRVFYFEKGSDYYFGNTFFWIKLALFAGVFVLTIYPTRRFIGWSRELVNGQTPTLTPEEVKKIKRAIHWQLMLIAGMILCASLLAKGAGF